MVTDCIGLAAIREDSAALAHGRVVLEALDGTAEARSFCLSVRVLPRPLCVCVFSTCCSSQVRVDVADDVSGLEHGLTLLVRNWRGAFSTLLINDLDVGHNLESTINYGTNELAITLHASVAQPLRGKVSVVIKS